MKKHWIHEHPLCLAQGLAPEALGRGRVLHVDGSEVYVGRGQQLLRSQDGGLNFVPLAVAAAGPLIRNASRIPLAARLLRTGFHGLEVLSDGSLLAIVRGALLHKRPDSAEFTVAHQVTRGNRPLNVCVHPSGRVYFGEYFRNKRRSAVHVYGSDNGTDFDVAGTFSKGSVRHIHGIHWDEHRGGMWVLTGDDGEESGLWWTPDEFVTLEPVLRGTQAARAVTLFAERSGLILPMDTPFEQNYVQHFDPQSGKLERLAELPGSVFHSSRTRHLHLLSTVVERSAVNSDPRPALLASHNGFDWRVVARLRRDLPQLKDKRPYFQWPTIVLPSGRSDSGRVLASGQGVLAGHDRLLSWSEDELLEHLRQPIQRLAS